MASPGTRGLDLDLVHCSVLVWLAIASCSVILDSAENVKEENAFAYGQS